MKRQGWILDAYPSAQGMTIWFVDDEANSHFLFDSLTASFYVYGSHNELHSLCVQLHSAGLPIEQRRAERHDLFERRDIELLEIAVPDPLRFTEMVGKVKGWKPALTYYNCTVPLAQIYFYDRQLFPLARVEVDTDADRRIRAIQLQDSQWDIDYRLPPLKTMTIRLEGEGGNPNHDARPRPLEISVEGTSRVLVDDDNKKEFIIRVKELLEYYDPDLILTVHGDDFILPRLLDLSRRVGIPLPLNRAASQAVRFRAARSYYSYGQIVFRAASHSLFGRLHLDVQNTFLFKDYQMEGLFEMARLAQMPLQRTARTSTGTCLSSMELSTAYRNNVLIPSVKRESEAFQAADQLVIADKAGLVFQPILGLHERVAELDFPSMFPFIMHQFNVSAETLNCSCCSHTRVPELNLTICQKRVGLVPATIAPVVAKRIRLKEKIRTLPQGEQRERYKRLASCGKWIGVVSFGYMGHRNAVFGNVTAHQAICAFARDRLLIAKECAERRGFRMLHAIVDALYLQKKNVRDGEYAELTQAITEATQLRIELEGVYNWIAFLPSKQDPEMPVANRYYGVQENGDVKIRGIEVRRGDTPLFIQNAQNEMIAVLATAKNRAEFRERAVQVLSVVFDYLDRLRSGQVSFEELAITQHLTRAPHEYTRNTLNAIVAKELMGSGVELAPGEDIQYVILDHAAHAPSDRVRALEHIDPSLGYDVEKYEELFLKSVATLLAPIGVSQDALEEKVAEWRVLPPVRRAQLPLPQQELPLFEWIMHNQFSQPRKFSLR